MTVWIKLQWFPDFPGQEAKETVQEGMQVDKNHVLDMTNYPQLSSYLTKKIRKKNSPKLMTSKTLTVPSSPNEAHLNPLQLATRHLTGHRWHLNTFTNSIDSSNFFQNFKNPSWDAVTMKLVLKGKLNHLFRGYLQMMLKIYNTKSI